MNQIKCFEIKLKNDIDEIINGNIYLTAQEGKFPLIIMSHGFRAWKDWGFNPYVAKELSKAGFITLIFNFSLNGRITNNGFIDIEKFARNSISQELSDLEFVIEYFISNDNSVLETVRKKWNNEIVLFGFSLGSGISILESKSDNRINKLVLWSTIGKFNRYSERQKLEWEKKGFIEFPNTETNQILKLNYNFLSDLENNKKMFNLADAIQSIDFPILIIHGNQDVTVPVKEINTFFENENKSNIRKKIIEHTGHTFGVVHPMGKITQALKEAITETKEFLFEF